MSDVKVNVYTNAGFHLGYFLNPRIEVYPEGDYELHGQFFDSNGSRVVKLELNPQALPYSADLREASGVPDKKLESVFIHRGRQPVMMTGRAPSN